MKFIFLLFLVFCLEKMDAVQDSFTAILLYESFVEAYPEKPELLYSLGKSYYDIQAWPQSILAFEKTLSLQPENPDAKLFLAYALLFQAEAGRNHSLESINKSQELFREVLKEVPDYEDAKKGLARTEAELKPSEIVVKKEEVSPPPPTPPHPPKKKGPKTSEVLLGRAKELSSQENHWGAIEIYSYLTEKFPDNAEYFFFLGREYVRASCRCLAKQFFERSLEIKADYSDSLIFLGKYYLFDKCLCEAKDLFTRAIESNPKDVAGFIGLARVEELLDNVDEAEANFKIAYEMEPDNPDVMKPYADFLYNQRRYCEAEILYRVFDENTRDFDTYRHILFDISSFTTPTFFAKAGTAEEREKDLFSKRWVASLRYYATEVGGIFTLCDSFRIVPRIRAGTTRQRLLQLQRTQFDVKSVGGGIKGEWIVNPAWGVIGDLSMEWISNNHSPVLLPTKRGVLFEPTLIFRYQKFLDTVYFGETADSIIFRDFEKRHVRVVTRNAALFSYQRDFEDFRYFGTNLAWIWYQDRIHNQEQDANIWFQAGFPYIEELLSARYQCDYRHFYHETNGYYSFQYQLTHWLTLRSIHRWLCGVHYEFEYWHGWRTTKGRNPQQQLVVTPTPQFIPVTTVENQIDQVFITLGYMPNDAMDLFLWGTYYHDSFDYTIIGAKIELDWRF